MNLGHNIFNAKKSVIIQKILNYLSNLLWKFEVPSWKYLGDNFLKFSGNLRMEKFKTKLFMKITISQKLIKMLIFCKKYSLYI